MFSGVNITQDVSSMVTSLVYVDRLSDYSGECEVIFEDRSRIWQTAWYPQMGDEVAVALGYRDGSTLDCGEFQIDEIESSGPPDQLVVRCIAAWITPAMRTRKSVAYEGVTLSQLAAFIASQYDFTLSTASLSSLSTFDRITQRHESDLEFLKRIARAHGLYFTVRANQLVFYDVSALETQPSATTVKRRDVEEFRFMDRSFRIFEGADVSYHLPAEKRLISQQARAAIALDGGDRLRQVARCETDTQAAARAVAELYRRNSQRRAMSFTAPGDPSLMAGNMLTAEDFGENSGLYLIDEARHVITGKTGYRTRISAHRVGS